MVNNVHTHKPTHAVFSARHYAQQAPYIISCEVMILFNLRNNFIR